MKSRSMPIGLLNGKPFLWSGNIVVDGGPATGKTRCIAINRLLAAGQAEESVVCFEPHGELAACTENYFRKKGYEIRTEDINSWEGQDRFERGKWYRLAESKWACFIQTNHDDTMSGVFNVMLDHILDYLDIFDLPTCPVPVHFVFDDFTTCGKIDTIEDCLTMDRRLANGLEWNSLGVDFTVVYRGIEALADIYGAAAVEKILLRSNALIFTGAGCAKHAMLKDAQYFQNMCFQRNLKLSASSDELVLLPDGQELVLTKYDFSKNPESKNL